MQMMAPEIGPLSNDEVEHWFKMNLAHWEQTGFGFWILSETESGKLIGRGGLKRPTDETPKRAGNRLRIVAGVSGDTAMQLRSRRQSLISPFVKLVPKSCWESSAPRISLRKEYWRKQDARFNWSK